MPTIPCEICKGSGRIPLPEVLQQVYDAVERGTATAPEIWAASPDRAIIGATAINRRLARLMELGLVTRQRGPNKTHIYSITPTPKKETSHGRRKTDRS